MVQNKENSNHYIADEGKTFVRKSDGRRMGAELWLGEFDMIANYDEVTDERLSMEGAR